MPITPADLTELSHLLDAALALPAADRKAWLLHLAGADRRHADMLEQMLDEHAAPSQARLLASLPVLGREAASPHSEVAKAGGCVGPYRLIRELGRGGMGTVWLAARSVDGDDRDVALKLPRSDAPLGLVQRMARERDIGARLSHPNIARQYDAGVDAHGRPFIALEYIDGQAIDVWCAARALSVPDRLRLFLQVARAVAYVHARNVVHRDLKPANVLVTSDGQAHLLDFGIAKLLHDPRPHEANLTQELGRMLTPQFASPEQLSGEPITMASDVFSLGVLMYGLLTGGHPFSPACQSAAAMKKAIETSEPAPASSRAACRSLAKALKGDLDAILAKTLVRDPARRYGSADALADDIERHLGGTPVAARGGSWLNRLREGVPWRRLAWASR